MLATTGDSVSNGYFLEGTPGTNVPDLLADAALSQHAPFSPGSGGAGPTSHGLDCLEVYLQLATGAPAHYDAISFNFGLHDLGNKPSDIATYTKQLEAIADRLLKTKSKLLYLMTTPMMPGCCAGAALLPSGEGAPVPSCAIGKSHYRCDSVVVQLNAAAAKVMAARSIPTLDLHKTVTDVCAPQPPHIYTNCTICRMEPCSYHYKPTVKLASNPHHKLVSNIQTSRDVSEGVLCDQGLRCDFEAGRRGDPQAALI